MADYQIVTRSTSAKALIDWALDPTLVASVTRDQGATSCTVFVDVACTDVGLQLLLAQWTTSSSAPLILKPGRSAKNLHDINPNWPVEIRVSSNGNTLVMNDWASALQLGGWNLLNSAQTQVKINAQP